MENCSRQTCGRGLRAIRKLCASAIKKRLRRKTDGSARTHLRVGGGKEESSVSTWPLARPQPNACHRMHAIM
jgi:hypothetical protein